MKKLCWFAFFLILTVSCLDDPDCFQLNNNVLGITFRVIGTGQADSTLLKGLTSPTGVGVVTSVSYNLNYFQERDSLVFQGEKKNNFLSFVYAVKNQFISEDCGSRFVLSDLMIFSHDFDSARVVNATPSKTGGPNIDVYRCPETDTLTINLNQLSAISDGVAVSGRTSTLVSHQFDSIISDFSGKVFSGRAATINLPVDLDKTQTELVFKRGEVQDTLLVSYNTTTEQRYNACGIQTFVNDLRVVSHTFDSISFALDSNEEPVRTLLDPHVPNFRIFDCPKMNLLQVAFKSGTAAQSVLIKGVTADHLSGNLLKEPTTVSSLNLPVDTESDGSTFYIQYENKTDTLSIQYTRSPVTLFNACEPQMIIRNLSESIDLENASIPANGTNLHFPTIPNVEITVN